MTAAARMRGPHSCRVRTAVSPKLRVPAITPSAVTSFGFIVVLPVDGSLKSCAGVRPRSSHELDTLVGGPERRARCGLNVGIAINIDIGTADGIVDVLDTFV